ncbi:hypothetical protein MPER_11683, partial [Moniliophthora perniciosa FA553]
HSNVALAMLSGEISEMEGLALKYGQGWNKHQSNPAQVENGTDGDVVLLTGSTAGLLEGNTALKSSELEHSVFERLRREVTCIIHAAGTRRLADLALSSPHQTPPRLVFVSSVNVFNNWTEGTIAPEAFNSRPATAIGSGYAESKWVAEKILVKAAEQTTLRPVIVRIGQISGGPDGSWSAAEWFPTLVASGQVLRCLPHAQGYISWIPAHHAANALIEIRKNLMESSADTDDMDIDEEIPLSPDSGSYLILSVVHLR